MSARKVAIIGDHFMLPDMFQRALAGLPAPQATETRSLQLQWPDVPMREGDCGGGVSEYVGDPDEVARFIGDAEILINHLAPVTRAMLEQLPDLKFIVITRGGPVNMDLKALAQKSIAVASTPGRNASAVAEFAVGMILTETRRIRAGHEGLRRGQWRGDLYRADSVGDELADLSVGIIGYGKIGAHLARLLRPFNCRLLAADPHVDISNDAVRQVSQRTLLAESDIVVLAARVTAETAGMIGAGQLQRMKKTALLVNVARGPLVDYGALYEALAKNTIAAAVLDTFSVEPPAPDWPLLQLPNVTLTPHIAGASRRTIKIAAECAAEEVRRYLAGEPPLNPVIHP
ncbi:MAG: 2-hydroxyacid dehydrogenase [Gammaproteobacteria bacterium]|nr:2-hydroxyacid dehydrogenase [Gammaproteobacteria bacterium]